MKCSPRASRPSDPSLLFIVCLEKDLRSIATVMKSVCSTHSRSMYILSSKLLQLYSLPDVKKNLVQREKVEQFLVDVEYV